MQSSSESFLDWRIIAQLRNGGCLSQEKTGREVEPGPRAQSTVGLKTRAVVGGAGHTGLGAEPGARACGATVWFQTGAGLGPEGRKEAPELGEPTGAGGLRALGDGEGAIRHGQGRERRDEESQDDQDEGGDEET